MGNEGGSSSLAAGTFCQSYSAWSRQQPFWGASNISPVDITLWQSEESCPRRCCHLCESGCNLPCSSRVCFFLLIFRLRPLYETKYYRKHRLIRETAQITSNRHIAQYLIGCITKEQLVYKKEHQHIYLDQQTFALTSSRKSAANPFQNNLQTTYQQSRHTMRFMARNEVRMAIQHQPQPAIPNPNLPVIPGVRQDRILHGGIRAWNPNTRIGLRLPPGVFTPLLPQTRPIIAVGNAFPSWQRPHAAVNNQV